MAFGIGQIVSGLFGSTSAGKEAAQIAAAEAQKARQEIRRQFDETKETLDPFVQAGTGQIGQVEASATPQGLGDMLAQIFGQDALRPLIDERTRAIQGQLSAGGLTRSGTALREIANVPTELGLGIEQLLSGRSSNLLNTGLGAATNLGQFGANQAAQQAQTFQNTGNIAAQGRLIDANARNRQLGAIGELGGQLAQSGLAFAGAGAGGLAGAQGPTQPVSFLQRLQAAFGGQ